MTVNLTFVAKAGIIFFITTFLIMVNVYFCLAYFNSSNVLFSIQDAINQAIDGDVIFVPSGIYFENVVVNKSISLHGENPEDTIIDGRKLNSVVNVVADNVEISGFTIRNGLHGIYADGCFFVNITLNKIEDNNYGIFLDKANLIKICKNNITRNNAPIVLQNSQRGNVIDNILFHNFGQALSIYRSNGTIIMGNLIEHNPAFGIYVERSENNILKWNNITYVCEGIHLQSSKNNLIARNTITNTGPYAIILNFSDENCVHENSLANNEIALQLSKAHSNMVIKNNITHSKLGVFISCSRNNVLRNNVISNSWVFGNFGVYGERLDDFINDIDTSNIVDGKPIYYLINQHDLKFSLEDVGYIAVVNSSNVILEKLNLSGNYQAITLALSFNITLRNLHITKSFQGIYLFQTNYSKIIGNSFQENAYNFYIHNSHFNLIFHNNFFDGKLLTPFHSQNFWDAGYPQGGNYWGGLQIQDKFIGCYQNITGSDGIHDLSLHLYDWNVDRYPLAAPVKTYFTDYSEDHFVFISNSTIINFNFVPSEGPYISFNAVGPEGTLGFCRVSIPKKLLWVTDSEWRILIGGSEVSYAKFEDEAYTHLFFYYNHTLDYFMIHGTDAVPEFFRSYLLQFMIFLSFMVFLIRRFSYCIEGKNLNFCSGKYVRVLFASRAKTVYWCA